MHRFRITVEYDGTAFSGWQRQAGQPSVQQQLEDALKALGCGEVTVFGAGRTDAGVHAAGQVAHFDLARPWQPDRLMAGINAHLRPSRIAVLDAAPADADFHARYSAIARHYEYRILTRRAPPALDHGRVWWVPHALDAAAMHGAAQLLLGRHDFTTFRSSQCQAKSPVKTLDRLDVSGTADMVTIAASARSFLHNQVRSLAGTLKLVGEGKWSAGDVEAALSARDRSACAPVAPPHGLCLLAVDYPLDAG